MPLFLCSSLALAQSAAAPGPAEPAAAATATAARPVAAGSAATPSALPAVEVRASRDDVRRQDSAAVTVIGRADLLRFGDQSVAEALRRVPGITVVGAPGRGGDIRLRGLGEGYTRLLLDGQPVPNGFAIDSLSPEQIERVEVMRVATAASGAQAIAGTINIVLRKAAARAGRDAKAALTLSHDRLSPELSGNIGSRGAQWTAALGIVAVDGRSATADADSTSAFDGAGVQLLQRRGQGHIREHRSTVNLTPRLGWTFANGDTLTSQNFIRLLALEIDSAASERTSIGAATSFPDNQARFRAHAATVKNELQWLHRMAQGARLEVQLGHSHFQRGAFNVFAGAAAASHVASDSVVRTVDSTAREDSLDFSGKYSVEVGAGHALSAGWDGARGSRSESRFEIDSALARAGAIEQSSASQARLALYVEDDWTATPALSLSLGARLETVRIASDGELAAPLRRRLHAGGPLLQARLKSSSHGQWRLGLTRTFKLPTLSSLSMRRYTTDNGNSPLSPDQQGNPALLPERAWGLDLAYEHYFDKHAMLSVSLYARRIDDVTIALVEQVAAQAAPQSGAPTAAPTAAPTVDDATALALDPFAAQAGGRWLSRAVNAGRAQARGIEFELKTTMAGSELRLHGARNWSHIDSLPGPDHGLPGQLPWSAGAAIDRRLARWPLSLSASLAAQGGGRWQAAAPVAQSSGSVRTLDLSALWRIDARSSWRLSLSNLLARPARSDALYRERDSAGRLYSATTTPTWASVRLAYEAKL